MVSVDFKAASLILDRAFIEANSEKGLIGQKITEILRGPHKTYRYVLVTALLAKATNKDIDILSLQKGDEKMANTMPAPFATKSLCLSKH